MSWPLLVVLGAVAAIWLRWRYRHRRMLAMAQKIPGPPPLPMLGNALQFMCQPDDFIRVIKNLMQEYGDVVRFWLGPDLNVMVSDPDDLKALLTNMKTSFKGPQYKYMADMIGDGILSGSGPLWRKHRKIATPNYGKRAIESYSEVFNQEVELLLASIRTKIGRQLNVYQYIVQTTSYAVCHRGYLERTIISNKGSIERAKEKFEKICTYRTMWPKFFTNFYVREEVKIYGDDLQITCLPKLTKDHCRMVIIRCAAKTLKPTFIVDVFRYSFEFTEYIKAHDYVRSYIMIFDYSEFNLKEYISLVNITEFRQCLAILLDGYEARVQGIHFISESKLLEILVKIMKQVLSIKLGERIHVHKKFESIYDYVSKASLPIEYGGEEKSIRTIYENWIDVLSAKEHVEYKREMNNARTDESLRQKDGFNVPDMGVPGTFRTLNVD